MLQSAGCVAPISRMMQIWSTPSLMDTSELKWIQLKIMYLLAEAIKLEGDDWLERTALVPFIGSYHDDRFLQELPIVTN